MPFLAPDLVGIAELDFDLTLGTYDIDARFENPRLPLFSQWAHSVHAALSYTSFVVDAHVHLLLLPRSDAGLRPERDSGDGPHRGR